MVTALGDVREIHTQTRPMCLTVDTPWGPIEFKMPFVVLPGPGNLVIIGQRTLREICGIDVDALVLAMMLPGGSGGSRPGKLPPLVVTQNRLHMTVEAFEGQGDGNLNGEGMDVVTEELRMLGPKMFMPPPLERRAREAALLEALDDAVRSGLPRECEDKLRKVVLGTHLNAFRRALTGEEAAKVQPMIVKRKPGAHAVRAKPRVYSPEKIPWLAEHMEHLEKAGMVFRNNQAIFGSVAMAIPKGEKDFRLVSDYRAVNALIEQNALPMPNLEDVARLFAHATAFCTLDLLQGYWQMPLRRDAREMFTMVTPGGLFTPTRVPQGVLNATAYFQAVMRNVLDGLIDNVCLVWVDDIVIWGDTAEELV